MGIFKKSEEERIRAEDLMRSYVELHKLFAGKHLIATVDRIIKQAQVDEDSVSIKELTSNEVAFYRGIRTGLMRLQKEIELALKGGS